jgi:hypothetical protein
MTGIRFQKYFLYVTLKKVAEDDKLSLLKTFQVLIKNKPGAAEKLHPKVEPD